MRAPRVQAAAWVGLTGFLFSVSGCSDSNDPGGGGGDLVSQQIGPAGGTVRTPDGQLTLIFPAGAVAQTQTITIEPLEIPDLGSEFSAFQAQRAYELGPAGLALQQPVTVAMPAAQQVEQPDGSLKLSTGLLLTSAGGQVEALSNLRLEDTDGALVQRGELSHFSPVVYTKHFVTVTVTGIPDEVAVGTTFTARVSLTAELVEVTEAFHDDDSLDPIDIIETTSRDLERLAPNVFEGSFSYTCAAVADEASYAADVFYYASSPVVVPGAVVDVVKGLKCVAPPSLPTLTVTKTGSGTGTVTSNPAGISCGAGEGCTEQYAVGTSVALTATPDAGSVFVNWSGSCPGGSSLTTVVVDADKTCTAQFDLQGSALSPLGSVNSGISFSTWISRDLEERPLAALGNEARLFDVSNPTEPRLLPGGISNWSCPNAHDGFFINSAGAPNPVFVALRKSPNYICFGEVPLQQAELATLPAPPADGAAIPGSTNFVFGLDHPNGAGLVFVETGEGAPPPQLMQLTTGRACPNGVAATESKIYVVLSAGPNGTVDAECSVNGRKLAIIDIATRQSTFIPIDGDPQDIALSPDGRLAHIFDRSDGGVVWAFDPQLGIAVRRVAGTFGPRVSIATPTNNSLLVADGTANILRAFDATTGLETGSAPTGGVGAMDLSVSPDGRTVFVPHADGYLGTFSFDPAFRP